ncbi:MAG: HEAT repeat domain-containing protein, partial [Planctomycetota bacterium]
MRRTYWLLAGVLTLLFSFPLQAAEVKRVALMYDSPYQIEWTHWGEEKAILAAAGAILDEVLADTPQLHLVPRTTTTGIFQSMAKGLYFPTGDTPYARWKSLVRASAYVEVKQDNQKLTWTVYTEKGLATMSVARPRRAPKAVAAALVKVIFKALEQPLSVPWQKRLDDPEAKNAALFLEWAKWVRWRPHWCHDKPWIGPRMAAAKIIQGDPNFKRGLAWSLRMMRMKTIRMAKAPTAEEHFPYGFYVLDSEYAQSVTPIMRDWLKNPKLLAESFTYFGLDELTLSGDGLEEEEAATEGLVSGGNLMALKRPEGARLRRNLVKALAAIDSPEVKRVLTTVSKEDEDESVRTAATAALKPKAVQAQVAAGGVVGDEGAVRGRVKALFAEGDVTNLYQPLREAVANQVGEDRTRMGRLAYEAAETDRRALASLMLADPALEVNLSGIRMALRLADSGFASTYLREAAATHENEYVRARALRELDRVNDEKISSLCRRALASAFWILRLEAADILSRRGTEADTPSIKAALKQGGDEWLTLALRDALAKASGAEKPKRVRLQRAETKHTPGGNNPIGIQTWIGRMPKDEAERTRLVREEGMRFGTKPKEPNLPGGTTLRSYNAGNAYRNGYLLESVLAPLEKERERLPWLYYVILFDEPCTWGKISSPDRMRAFLLEVARPDLLETVEPHAGKGDEVLPEDLRRVYHYQNSRAVADASNWVVHMYRLTAQRRYPDLRIFPQSLSYMRKLSVDAWDVLDADGDYSWIYHQGHVFRDGSIGAINRVLLPNKPSVMVTWMGWHTPNIINGNTLYLDTDFPMEPWRLRGYWGLRSALSLYATGTEAGFFDPFGLGRASDKKGTGKRSIQGQALLLQPWSTKAEEAVAVLMDDPKYWEQVEGKLRYEALKKAGPGADAIKVEDDDDEDLDLELEETPKADPVMEALKKRKEEKHEYLMTGLSYMNIFGTDTTRALSNLPKPDTRNRSSLIIYGRDYQYFYADGSHFPIPAAALLDGYDMVPTYDCVAKADLMKYDTILLRACIDGVTRPLVEKINAWLTTKENGLLILWGDVNARTTQFAAFGTEPVGERFLWDGDVTVENNPYSEVVFKERRGKKVIERRYNLPPAMKAFTMNGTETNDGETRVHSTVSGKVTPLIMAGGKAVLARWQAPAAVKGVVLFSGASTAGPIYTEALEKVITGIDAERKSVVTRNRYWGHVVYENNRFVVDVAGRQFGTLLKARPRQHRGVDIVTGVINPRVAENESALILKDYVGPYAGGRGDWAVLARKKLRSMTVEGETRLRVDAVGVTRVSHI